ncbi:hypothetical protein RESH_02487 [Rhodopirellula europaea SH398]|uniref:Uncharacterized protein n=1 Tax=Rhodopirellula europaea SH398 TaxID=1263868 RepID=M5S5Y4_9BACT|nr:hypothetical protein RESH_02487 [Rhodopirellula europaea SH398]
MCVVFKHAPISRTDQNRSDGRCEPFRLTSRNVARTIIASLVGPLIHA